MNPRNHPRNPTYSTQVPIRESQHTSETFYSIFWKSQKMERKIKPRIENNIGGVNNTVLEKDMGIPPQVRIPREADLNLIKQQRKH